MRRLVLRPFLARVAHQLAQVLAVGGRIFGQQFAQGDVAVVQQARTPGFHFVQQRRFAFGRVAAYFHRIADGVQGLVAFPPHLLGQKLQLPLARDVRRDPLGVVDVFQQVFGNRQFGQMRRRQRHQFFAQATDVQRFATLLAAAGPQEFAGFRVGSTHFRSPELCHRISH